MADAIAQTIHAFILLLVIMDPVAALPVFLRITQKFTPGRRVQSANRAIRFSAILLALVLLFGQGLLDLFGISFDAFRIAGGIVLLVLGITYMFHIHIGHDKPYATDILVPFATPLIVGPGVMTTAILFVGWYGLIPTAIAATGALAVCYATLRFANPISARLGLQGIEVVTRLMGLILVAFAVQMMRDGIAGFITSGIAASILGG